MMMKQDSIATACGNCGVEERRFFHHLRHRGIFRRLCTSCVLRLHSQSFCPTCFIVYDGSPPPSNDTVTCFKCYSSSHSNCVGSNASTPYVCPPCANPNVPLFSVKKVKDGDCEGKNESCIAIDKKAARVLLAAASIAAISMNKAAVAVRAEAEKRAREATSTRKKAKEALEHVACLVAKEKLKRKEELSADISGPGNVGVLVKNRIGGNAISSVAAVSKHNRNCNQLRVDRVDSSSEVLAALNRAQSAVSGAPSNTLSMNVEENDRLGVSSVSNVGALFVQNHVAGNENERSGDSGHLDNHNSQGEKVSNGLRSVPLVDQPQYMQRSHAGEENIGSQQ